MPVTIQNKFLGPYFFGYCNVTGRKRLLEVTLRNTVRLRCLDHKIIYLILSYLRSPFPCSQFYYYCIRPMLSSCTYQCCMTASRLRRYLLWVRDISTTVDTGQRLGRLRLRLDVSVLYSYIQMPAKCTACSRHFDHSVWRTKSSSSSERFTEDDIWVDVWRQRNSTLISIQNFWAVQRTHSDTWMQNARGRNSAKFVCQIQVCSKPSRVPRGWTCS